MSGRCGSRIFGYRCELQEGHDLPHSAARVANRGVIWEHGDEGDAPRSPGLSNAEIRLMLAGSACVGAPARETLIEQLLCCAGQLAVSRIYEDPHVERGGVVGNALYCSECQRYGILGKPIEHAESCLVGKVIGLVRSLTIFESERKPKLTERELFIAGRRMGFADGGVVPAGTTYLVGERVSEFHCDLCGRAADEFWGAAGRIVCRDCPEPERPPRPDREIVYFPERRPTAVELA